MNANNKNTKLAVTSLVLGIISLLCLGILAGIPAIILGHIAHNRTRRQPDQYGGAGLAIAGFACGYASLLVTVILVALFLPLVTGLNADKDRALYINCSNNLKQVVFLDPAPAEARTGGLKIELESAPARIVNDSDKLDRAFPDVMETLLIYDTVMLAFAVEDSQGYEGEMPDGYLRLLANIRKEFEKHFYQYIEQRSFGRVFSEPLRLGD